MPNRLVNGQQTHVRRNSGLLYTMLGMTCVQILNHASLFRCRVAGRLSYQCNLQKSFWCRPPIIVRLSRPSAATLENSDLNKVRQQSISLASFSSSRFRARDCGRARPSELSSFRVTPRILSPTQCIIRNDEDDGLRRRQPGWMQYLVIFQ